MGPKVVTAVAQLIGILASGRDQGRQTNLTIDPSIPLIGRWEQDAWTQTYYIRLKDMPDLVYLIKLGHPLVVRKVQTWEDFRKEWADFDIDGQNLGAWA